MPVVMVTLHKEKIFSNLSILTVFLRIFIIFSLYIVVPEILYRFFFYEKKVLKIIILILLFF